MTDAGNTTLQEMTERALELEVDLAAEKLKTAALLEVARRLVRERDVERVALLTPDTARALKMAIARAS